MMEFNRMLMIIFNIVFSITGIIIISAGLGAKAYFHEFDSFLDAKYIYVSDLLIIVGVIIFFIAFFGCCGALKENACMTTTFSTLLIVIFIIELMLGIAAVLLKSKTEEFLEKSLDDTISRYNKPNQTEVTELWDQIQQQFECCGVLNYTDWETYGGNNGNSHNSSLPISCCKIPPGSMGNFTCDANNPKNVYREGCLAEFGDYIRGHIGTVEGVGIGLAVIQLLGILISCYLAKRIRNDYETV